MENWKKEKYKESKYTEHNNGQKYFQLQASNAANTTTCKKNYMRVRFFCIYIVRGSTCLLCHILPSVFLSICPFVRMYQRFFHWTDFLEI